jgi:hypothetical protein
MAGHQKSGRIREARRADVIRGWGHLNDKGRGEQSNLRGTCVDRVQNCECSGSIACREHSKQGQMPRLDKDRGIVSGREHGTCGVDGQRGKADKVREGELLCGGGIK